MPTVVSIFAEYMMEIIRKKTFMKYSRFIFIPFRICCVDLNVSMCTYSGIYHNTIIIYVQDYVRTLNFYEVSGVFAGELIKCPFPPLFHLESVWEVCENIMLTFVLIHKQFQGLLIFEYRLHSWHYGLLFLEIQTITVYEVSVAVAYICCKLGLATASKH